MYACHRRQSLPHGTIIVVKTPDLTAAELFGCTKPLLTKDHDVALCRRRNRKAGDVSAQPIVGSEPPPTPPIRCDDVPSAITKTAMSVRA